MTVRELLAAFNGVNPDTELQFVLDCDQSGYYVSVTDGDQTQYTGFDCVTDDYED